MKKYFHKITAMLLAACMAVPAVAPVTAYADDGIGLIDLVVGRSKLSLGAATVTKDNNEYTYQYKNVSVPTATNEDKFKMMLVEFPDGKVELPSDTRFDAVSTVITINTDNYKRITMSEGVTAADAKAYIEQIKFVAEDSNVHQARVLLSVDSYVEDNAWKAGYYKGHFYQYMDAKKQIYWEDANAAASADSAGTFMQRRGYLATANTATEMQIIQKIAANRSAWMGGQYLEEEGKEAGFYWVTGPEGKELFYKGKTYETNGVRGELNFWDTKEPSDSGENGEPYVLIKTNGTWNDMPAKNNYDHDPNNADHPKGYIVEYGGLSDNFVFERDDMYFCTTGTLQTFEVEFSLDGGAMPDGSESQVAKQIVAIGGNAVQPTAIPLKDDYTFKGWFTDSSCNKPWDPNNLVTDTMTIYAGWTLNPIVEYDEDGDGTIENGEYEIFAPETTVTINTGAGTGTYTFDPVSGPEENGNYTPEGATQPLPKAGDRLTLHNPARTDGATFAGWSLTYNEDNNTAEFTANWVTKAAVNYLKYVENATELPTAREDVTLTRHPVNTITVAPNGGTYENEAAQHAIVLHEGGLTLGEPTREDYTFNGWLNEERTFTAQWLENPTFTYKATDNTNKTLTSVPVGKTLITDENGGTKMADYVATTGAKVTIPDATGKEGFTFAGWVYSVENDTYKLTAQWKQDAVVQYQAKDTLTDTNQTLTRFPDDTMKLDLSFSNGETVTYYVDGKAETAADDKNPVVITLAAGVTNLGTPERAGHTFNGWTYSDRTFTANWLTNAAVTYLDADKYGQSENKTTRSDIPVGKTLHIDDNDGMEGQQIEAYVVTAGGTKEIGNPERTGYTFKGWKYVVENDTYQLTAQWMKNPIVNYNGENGAADAEFAIDTVITIDPVGGTVDDIPDNCKLKLEEGGVVTLKDATKAEHTFQYWDLNGTTFTAKWKANPAVTYSKAADDLETIPTKTTVKDMQIDAKYTLVKGNGEENVVANVQDTAASIEDPVRAGYVFMGWVRTEKNGAYTFTAQWAEDKLNAERNDASGDSIADLFQRKVTFSVVGGTWTDGMAEPIEKIVTLQKGGICHAEGSAEVDLPPVGSPVPGYKAEGSWKNGEGTLGEDVTKVTISKDTPYTYTYQFIRADAVAMTYSSTERNADNQMLEKDIVNGGVPYNSKIQLVPDDQDDSKNSLITATEETKGKVNDPAEKTGYVFMGWKKETVTDQEYQYRLTAVWAEDKDGNHIPDTYEVKVTFKVVGGQWSNGATSKTVKAAYEVWDDSSFAVVRIPADMQNVSGYRDTGSWSDGLGDKTEVKVKADTAFTYTFSRKASSGHTSTPQKPAEDKQDRTEIPAIFTGEHIAYVKGYEDGTVKPNAMITRAEVATILYNLLTPELQNKYRTTENDFTDVPEDMWFNTAISTLASMELLKGYEDGTFGPDKYITRAELAALLSRFEAEVQLKDGVTFNDIAGSWAKEQILLTARRGWISGYPDGSFKPAANITRAETMAMINRMMQRNPRTIDDLHANVKYWVDNSDVNEWFYIHVQEATKTHSFTRDAEGYETRA